MCTLPITADVSDQRLMLRLNGPDGEKLAVYCVAHGVPVEPKAQRFVHEVPAMIPLPPAQ